MLNRKIDLVTANALKEQMKPLILSQILYIWAMMRQRTYKMYFDDILTELSTVFSNIPKDMTILL